MNSDDLLLDIILLIEEYPYVKYLFSDALAYEQAKEYLIKKKIYD